MGKKAGIVILPVFITAFMGYAACVAFPRVVKNEFFRCLLTGFSAGLLTVVACFGLLPAIFENWGIFRGFVFIIVAGAMVYAACSAVFPDASENGPQDRQSVIWPGVLVGFLVGTAFISML
jgi:zinc transporter ZupT